jgi:hypothetical protein
MSNISDKLHDLLSQEFEYDRSSIFEFGWCNIIEAEDRIYTRKVKLYVPRDDVWQNSAAKKLIRKQFKAYYDEKIHECLPEAIDLLEGKNALGRIVLVTSRSQTINLMDGERQGRDISWLENDEFPFPEKLGAVRKLVEAVNILHGFGMVHGALGHQTISTIKENKTITLRIELLNFSDVTSDDPTPSLFFEPAFTAPELFEGGPSNEIAHKSKTTDVYSLGKFILYFLLGPVRFIKFFSQDDEEIENPKKVISTKLTDHILWTNIAHSNAELDPAQLEKISNEKLNAEIAEFLSYTVSNRASIRPDDAQMFFHGLTTIMSGEIEMPTAGQGNFMQERSGSQYGILPWVGAGVVILLIGGYFFMNARAEKQAFERQLAATNQSCSAFFGSLNELKDSRVTSLAGWGNIEFARDRVKKNGKADDKMAQNQKLCDQGNSELSGLKGSLIKKLKTDIALAQDNSVEEGTDYSELNIDAVLEQAAVVEKNRDFAKTETILGGLSDKINDLRDAAITADLDQAISQNSIVQGLLKLKDISKTETNLISKAKTALALKVSSENIAKKKAALGDVKSFNLSRLSADTGARLSEMQKLSEKLKAEDAGDANVGFSDVSADISSLQSQGLPELVSEYQGYYQDIEEANTKLSEINTYMEGLEAELPRFTQSITGSLDAARRNNWLEEAQIAILSSQFKNRESFSIYKDWSFLGKLDRSLTEEVSKLEAQWAEGNSVCSAMLASVDESQNMETTLIWPELSEIVSRIRSIDPTKIGRANFSDCEKGYSLSKRGNIELQAKELVDEIKETLATLSEKGAGSYIEAFSLASDGYNELKEINLPQSQASYDTYASKAYLIFANLDKAEEVFADAVSKKASLTRKYDDLNVSIKGTPLGEHPEYIRLLGELTIPESLNILEYNSQLQTNLETLEELVRRFESGTLINCNFDNGMEMLPILSDADKLQEGADRIKKAVKKSGVAFTKDENGTVTFCIQSSPVTQEDLLAFGETLKVRQADIKTEIASVAKGSAGAAVNISYWLATRYAEWVSKETKRTVCVAPAISAVLAELSEPDKFETISTGELFRDGCGIQSAVRKKLVLYDVEDPSMTAGCVSSNSLRPELSFRLAAGDICTK